MNIENAKTTFFIDKEHYLAFRSAWAGAVNSPRAKSHLEPCDEEIKPGTPKNPGPYFLNSKGTGLQRVQGWITREHVILYSLLRGKPADWGFTEVTSKNRLDNGTIRNHGLYHGVNDLHLECKNAISYQEPNHSKWIEDHLSKFLEPFGGTVTIDMLAKLTKHIAEIAKKVPYKSKGYKAPEEIKNENETSHRAAA